MGVSVINKTPFHLEILKCTNNDKGGSTNRAVRVESGGDHYIRSKKPLWFDGTTFKNLKIVCNGIDRSYGKGKFKVIIVKFIYETNELLFTAVPRKKLP
jgi:hypothetical protein